MCQKRRIFIFVVIIVLGIFLDLSRVETWAGTIPEKFYLNIETKTKNLEDKSKNIEEPIGCVSLTIDVEARKLIVFSDGVFFRSFPVAVGKSSTPSPIGEWRVSRKALNWGSGFGTRWIGLNVPWGIYGIHGTNKPSSIGTAASHGCIRMFNKDVELLYRWVMPGTKVRIVKSLPYKTNPPLLRKGQSNQDVVLLQFLLRKAGIYTGEADGRFGEMTEQAVKTFEISQQLPEDGIADDMVWRNLRSFVEEQKQPVPLQDE